MTDKSIESQAQKRNRAPKGEFVKTEIQYLYRLTSSGVYYVRAERNGKRYNQTLKSANGTPLTDFRLAKEALKSFVAAIDAQLATGGNAKATFAEVADAWLEARKNNEHIDESTALFYRVAINGVAPYFGTGKQPDGSPAFGVKPCRDCNAEDVSQWKKNRGDVMSDRTFNKELNVLKAIFEYARERGIIFANPAAPIKAKQLPDPKPATLRREEFLELVAEIRASGVQGVNTTEKKGHGAELEENRAKSANSADMVEGMAYTGCRVGEAAQLRWRDIVFDTGARDEDGNPVGKITVNGTPGEEPRLKGTKNGKTRHIPMLPAARALFSRMKAEAEAAGVYALDSFVFAHASCRTALVHAAERKMVKRLTADGMSYKEARKKAVAEAKPWTHHDFRHLFATTCIEAGVDIPTVAKWLGHQDGGALLMRVYAHIRDEHSANMALKVKFGSERPAVAA